MLFADKFRNIRGIILLLSLALACSPAFAQSAKGLIAGKVVDTQGASVPGAEIKLAPLNITVVSDDQGDFRLPEVPAGKYSLTVSYVGFAPQSSDVELAAEAERRKRLVQVAELALCPAYERWPTQRAETPEAERMRKLRELDEAWGSPR